MNYKTTGLDSEITETVQFYINNPTMPARFRVGKGLLIKAPTNNKSANATISTVGIPAISQLSVDGHYLLATLYRGEDLFAEKPNIYDKDGKLRGNIDITPILFVNGVLNIFASKSDIASLRKLEYLLYLSKYYPETNGGTVIVEYIRPEDSVKTSSLDAFKWRSFIDKLAISEHGKSLLVSKSMQFNNESKVIYEVSGIDKIVDILSNEMLLNISKFVKYFDNNKEEKHIITKALEKDVIGYNKKTESYQYKEHSGEFIGNDIIFSIREPDTSVREFLFADFLSKNKEQFAKLKLTTNNVKAKSKSAVLS